MNEDAKFELYKRATVALERIAIALEVLYVAARDVGDEAAARALGPLPPSVDVDEVKRLKELVRELSARVALVLGGDHGK